MKPVRPCASRIDGRAYFLLKDGDIRNPEDCTDSLRDLELVEKKLLL